MFRGKQPKAPCSRHGPIQSHLISQTSSPFSPKLRFPSRLCSAPRLHVPCRAPVCQHYLTSPPLVGPFSSTPPSHHHHHHRSPPPLPDSAASPPVAHCRPQPVPPAFQPPVLGHRNHPAPSVPRSSSLASNFLTHRLHDSQDQLGRLQYGPRRIRHDRRTQANAQAAAEAAMMPCPICTAQRNTPYTTMRRARKICESQLRKPSLET